MCNVSHSCGHEMLPDESSNNLLEVLCQQEAPNASEIFVLKYVKHIIYYFKYEILTQSTNRQGLHNCVFYSTARSLSVYCYL
jgi:hypothetical protein